MTEAVTKIVEIISWMMNAYGVWQIVVGLFLLAQNYNDQNPEANKKAIFHVISGIGIIGISTIVVPYLEGALTFQSVNTGNYFYKYFI